MITNEYKKNYFMDKDSPHPTITLAIKRNLFLGVKEINHNENVLRITVDKLYIVNNGLALQKRIFIRMIKLSITSFLLSLLFLLVGILSIWSILIYGNSFVYFPLALGLFIIGTTIFGTMFLINK
jgi:hypothetical protein